MTMTITAHYNDKQRSAWRQLGIKRIVSNFAEEIRVSLYYWTISFWFT